MTPEAIQIGFIAIIVTVIFSFINKKIVDQKRMREIKKKISDFQKRYAEAKKSGDQGLIKKMQEEQKAVMGLTKEMFTSSFKPMMVTFIPAIIVLFTLSTLYGGRGNIANLPIFGPVNWLWWYIAVSVIVGICFEIIYKIYLKKKGV